MSAPIVNPAVTANPAAQAAGGVFGRGAQTPVVGFEALLAALFPAAGVTPAVPDKVLTDAATADQAQSEQDAAADLTAMQAQLAALLAQVPVGTQPVATAPTAETTSPQTSPAAPKTLPADLMAALKDRTLAPALAERVAANSAAPAVPTDTPTNPAPTSSALPITTPDDLLQRTSPLVQPAEQPKTTPNPAVQAASVQAPAAPPANLKTEASPAPVAVLAPAQAAPAAPPAEVQAAVAVKTPKPDRVSTDPATHIPSQAAGPKPDGPLAQATPVQTAAAVLAAQASGDSADQGQPDSQEGQASSDRGAPDTASLPATGQPSIAHMIQAQAAAVATRGSPETVAKLAAQIIKKLEARTSRFDIALDPVGLGKVDVKVEIGAQGQMTAALSFDSAAAAAELRGRAGELRAALEQAGFDLGSGSLSFSFSGQGGEAGKQTFAEPDRRSAGRILQATATADAPLAAVASRSPFDSRPSGVDVRI